jgi:hypothetical protein
LSKKHKKWAKEKHCADHDKTPADHADCEPTMVYTVKIQPDPDEEKRRTDEGEYRKKQICSARKLNVISGIGVGIAGLTLIALIIYACITYGQLGAMRYSNTQNELALANAKEQFRIDQRPYVWIPPQSPSENNPRQLEFFIPAVNQPNQPVHVLVWYQNYGRSPAIITGFSVDAEIGQNAVQKLHRLSWLRFDSVLPPEKADTVIIPSRDLLSSDERSLIRTPGRIAAYMRVRYRDFSGHPYESDICFIYMGDKIPASYCPYQMGLTRMIDCKEERCEE